jgi:hypothetical protein
MAKAVSQEPLNAEVQLQLQASPRGISGDYFGFPPRQYHSINAYTHSFNNHSIYVSWATNGIIM